MKKLFYPIAALALLASCNPTSKDSYQTIPFPESNLIVDTQNASELAQVSDAVYSFKQNFSYNTIELSTSNLSVNNMTQSFETDTMGIRYEEFFYNENGTEQKAYKWAFSKKGSASANGSVTNLKGSLITCYFKSTAADDPNYELGYFQRLDLSYTLHDRYKVQTFWPTALYKGTTIATDDAESFSSRKADYVSVIDFSKKVGTIYLYNAEFSADPEKELPKVIAFEDIPIVFSHEGFSLQAAAPKTRVLGKNDNKTELIESEEYAATDFSFVLTSSDLTDAAISFKLDGKSVNFRGSSTLKSGF